MIFEFIFFWMSAYILNKCLQHNVKYQLNFTWRGFFILWKIDFLSTESFEDLTNLISIVINLTHSVLIEIHDFGLLIDDTLDFMNDSMIDLMINFDKEISQNINSSENITIFLFIHVFTELIFKSIILISELLHILLPKVLFGVIIINVSFKEFTCTLLLVNVLNSEKNDNK